jgi:hypothetical protein
MVFHADYEMEFEIYEKRPGDWRSELLGHMAGVTPQDAKIRWAQANNITDERYEQIIAVVPLKEWK